ncbi:MAG: type I polyketide synthase, partial [Phototrophicaceae bacterium]
MTPEPNRQQEIIKRSLLEIRDLKGKLQAAERTLHEPIAIVGIGCRFPAGADTPDSYWQLLKNGVDATREVPADRWDVNGYYDPNPDALGKMYTQRGGFLDRVDLFDPLFFNIPPREAVSMDPQHRLFVEVVWEALENAGIAPDSLANSKTGVFAGITAYDYAQLISLSRDPSLLDAYASTGNPLNFVSGRVSYLLGLQGPSMALDTACSSSLVSVHLACQNLRLGVIDMALAGGVNMVLSPETMVTLSKAKMLAADGRCKTFDASADGYARGEGGGVVVLKRLSDALRDGDNIWAVIRGSAVNQDGPSSGLTVPNGQAQQLVMREALALAGLNPHDVSYVDAHGTGTSLGDPIELRALEAVYGAGRSSENPLIVGSAKTNLGHLEAAAGIAGLIKIALTVHHGQIAPHLNLEHPNPNVAWDKLHIHVPTQGMPFPTHAASRIAAVSSFGASGTNGHIIVEAAPQRPIEQKPQRPLHVVTLSTKHPEDLRVLAERIVAELNAQPNASLADVATTLNSGRASMPYRAAIRAESLVGLKRTLTDYVANGASVNLLGGHARANQRPKIALLHTGKIGGGMGTALYATVAAFRAWVDQACAAMGVPANPIPAFALEFALGQLWGALGVTPSAVAGTGRGAIAAAVTAGAISLEEGAALAAARDAAEYAAVVDGLIPRAPRYPLYSSDGQALTAAMLDADYWRSLDDAIPLTLGGLVTAGNRVFIALGDTDIVPLHYGQGFSEGVASGELVTLESLAPDNDWNAL